MSIAHQTPGLKYWRGAEDYGTSCKYRMAATPASFTDKLERLSSRGLRAAIVTAIASSSEMRLAMEVAVEQQLDIRRRRHLEKRDSAPAASSAASEPSSTLTHLTPLYALLFSDVRISASQFLIQHRIFE